MNRISANSIISTIVLVTLVAGFFYARMQQIQPQQANTIECHLDGSAVRIRCEDNFR